MMFWVNLWKLVFILTILFFGVMALWVTVQGARDIKSLLSTLRREHKAGDQPHREP